MLIVKEQGAYYEIEGERYPRVSSILSKLAKPALVGAATKVVAQAAAAGIYAGRDDEFDLLKGEARRQWNAKAQKGTEIHAAIASCLYGDEYDSAYQWAVEQAAEVINLLPGGWFETEQVLVNRDLGYAGTADLWSNFIVADWKSGGLWPDHALQLWAYANATHRVTDAGLLEIGAHERPQQLFVVGLRPEAPEIVRYNLADSHVDEMLGGAFRGLLAVHRWSKAKGLSTNEI